MTKPRSALDLSSHIAALRKRDTSPTDQKENLIFWGTAADKSYLVHLKSCVGATTVHLRLEEITVLTQVKIFCAQKKIYKIITSSPSFLKKLLHWSERAAPSLSNYSGSYFTLSPNSADEPDIEIVFIPPLKQLVTVPYGKFLTRRYITKLTAVSNWLDEIDFTWDILKPENEAGHFTSLSQKNCILIAIDIETFRENATIRCISFCGFWIQEDGTFRAESYVLPLDSEYNLSVMRKWGWNLKAPKVFQNGKYDLSYLCRYNSPVYNYLYDTANFFHSWYSELPKDLGFLNAFFVRKAMYWKDLGKTNDLHEYYKYNALDTWGTGCAFLAMIAEAPDWAVKNYLLEFPLNFPCHMAEMRGINRDMDALRKAKQEQEDIVKRATDSLNKILDIPAGKSFNVNSPKQMKQLLKIIGCGDLQSADEKNLNKAKFRHPLNARILNAVIEVRKARKLISTYLTEGKEFKSLSGEGNRILYALNPHGTDSSRLASREHHFWCGLQIQNIPRGKAVKQTLSADPGFLMCEVDLEQAESRDTAYISGDEKLIHNVEYSPDFHCANASAFFGIPFEELYDVATGNKLNKAIRDLAKRVNHGANYNMGAYVLIDTMGEANILKAKALLGLPKLWTLIQVAEYLLNQFHVTYPFIKKVFYAGVIDEIVKTNLLVSKALHYCESVEDYEKNYDHAWTRYCFSDPTKSKSALNSYISHPPQSLNAQTLNKSFIKVFYDIAINPEHSRNFKLLAQIHDSIFFQYRIGHEYLCDRVAKYMEVPVTIKAYDGKIRTFVVPAGVKRGLHLEKQRADYWSETE